MKLRGKYQGLLQQYGLNVLMVLIFWGGMIRKNFNCDTLGHVLSEDADVMIHLMTGRYLMALGDYLLLKLGLRTTTNLNVTMTIALLILAMTMFALQSIFRRWAPDNVWAQIGFYGGINLVFLNVLFAEPLMFGECGVYHIIAYFIAAVGVKYFIEKDIFPCCLCMPWQYHSTRMRLYLLRS